VLTDADDGRTVSVTEGTDVVVRLQSNGSTGYQWAVASTDRTFGYPYAESYVDASTTPGTAGAQRFVWRTKAGPLSMIGAHTVTMEYRRSWETGVPPLDTFTFTVDITGAACPALSPPGPGFCPDGEIVPREDDAGCITGYDCEAKRPPPGPCVVGGCSSEICADEPRASACVFMPEYACYRTATCERQADGQCGWTETPELVSCLVNERRAD